MTDQLQMFSPEILAASANATSSPESAAGPLPPSLLACLPTGPYGPEAAHVSLSVRRDGGKVPTIHGICGPTSFASSTPVGPLESWENRLRARLATLGSTESPLIWEARVTPAGSLISRLRPWTPRKSGSGSGGRRSPWRAPQAGDERAALSSERRDQTMLAHQMDLSARAPWPAVQAADAGASSRSGDRKDELLLKGMMRANSPAEVSTRSTPRATDGENGSPNCSFSGGGTPLPAQMAQVSASPRATPKGSDAGPDFAKHDRSATGLSLQAQMAEAQEARPRAAPRAGDWRSGSSQVGAAELRPGGSMLPEQMTESELTKAAPWSTPVSTELTRGHGIYDQGGSPLVHQMIETEAGGPAPTGSSATTAKRGGSPTPLHPCWLQGFPAVWLLGAVWATRSASRSPRKSSKR